MMKIRMMWVLMTVLWAGCEAPPSGPESKIRFDLGAINDRGLIGPPDGLRSVSYEFCVPRRDSYMRQVMLADPSVRFFPGAPGRIGCGGDQVLCIGSTGERDWRSRLSELAELSYVKEIRETVHE